MSPDKFTTIDQQLVEWLLTNEKLNVDGWAIGNLILCLLSLLLSVLLCGTIGIEREVRGRSAGLRTHLLVGVGSCLLMIISMYGFQRVMNWDAARIAAAIVTGVGFLGAGAILNRSTGGIKGLTTAATIWSVMAIGVACGSFNFIIAIAGTALMFIVLTVFRKVEVRINKKNPLIVLTAPGEEPILDKILVTSKKYDCTVHGISTEMIENGEKREIQVTFQAVFKSGGERVIEYVSELEKETKATNVQLFGHR